jgi:asparagine synthase (glutamine-hydrolysing)
LNGLTQFLKFGCTLNWQTLFQGVQILPGGSVWTIENGRISKRCYFLPESWESQPPCPAEDFEDSFDETLKKAVRQNFVAGEKLGISLTAGLDTRMIMACRPETVSNPTCYTFSGEVLCGSHGLRHRRLRGLSLGARNLFQ